MWKNMRNEVFSYLEIETITSQFKFHFHSFLFLRSRRCEFAQKSAIASQHPIPKLSFAS